MNDTLPVDTRTRRERRAGARAAREAARPLNRAGLWAPRQESADEPMALLAVVFDQLRTELNREVKRLRSEVRRAQTDGARDMLRRQLTAAEHQRDMACDRIGREMEQEVAEAQRRNARRGGR